MESKARQIGRPRIVTIRLCRSHRRQVIVTLLLLLLLRFVALVVVPYTDSTEARYAEIARKMVETGNWITPQFDYGVPFWGKPPLHTWMAAGGMKAFGTGEFGGRITIFALSLALLALIHQWVKRERGRDAAWLGISVLTGCAVFYVSMGAVMTDLVMLSGTTLSMVAFWNVMDREQRPSWWGPLFFVGQAIGLLAKGPVAMVLTALPLLGWVLWQKRWKEVWHRLPWFSGLFLTLVITAPWYAVAELRTPGFLHYFLVGEHLQRFTVSGWQGDLYGSGHAKPHGMIWGYWALTMLPWTPFLCTPLFHWRRIKNSLHGCMKPWFTYLLCWAVSPLVFFSLASNIIPTYVLTGVPAVAILGVEAWGMTRWTRRRLPHAIINTSLASLLIFGTATVILTKSDGTRTKSSRKQIAEIIRGTGCRYNYYGKRSYSAEFYTAGKACRLGTIEEIQHLVSNGEPDALVIHQKLLPAVPEVILSGFQPYLKIGDDLIFIEKARPLEEVADVR